MSRRNEKTAAAAATVAAAIAGLALPGVVWADAALTPVPSALSPVPFPASVGPFPTSGRGLPATNSAAGSREAVAGFASGTPRPLAGKGTGDRALGTGNKAAAILLPASNAVLDVPAATVVVQLAPEMAAGSGKDAQGAAELRVNGTPVDAGLVGRTDADPRTGMVRQTYFGVALREGVNTLTLVRRGSSGGAAAAALAAVTFQVRGAASRLALRPQQTRVPADGRSTVGIEGQLIDAYGNRSTRDALVTLSATGGTWTGEDADPDLPGLQTRARDGRFSATLKTDLSARSVTVHAATADGMEASANVVFETDLRRPSIVTGVLDLRLGRRDTDFFRPLRDFLRAAEDGGGAGRGLDVRSQAFGTGRVGGWLLSGAYDTVRPLNTDAQGRVGLIRDLQPDQLAYPVYGDSSVSERLARSQDRLFLRLERNNDYALWGDYSTEEFAQPSQQFSAVTRQLHAFKANYHFGALQATGFFGDNVGGFQRDTIAPDGTSGAYFLSRRLLVTGSENVSLETEEYNRPGTVLERTPLRRTLDYDVDYDRGTLVFRRPILRTALDPSGNVLVRRIVVTYQYEAESGGRGGADAFGGRLRYQFGRASAGRESWLGTTYLRQNQGLRAFDLIGADALVSLAPNTRMVAEFARSNNDSDLLGRVRGSAYRVEAEHASTLGNFGLRGRAYFQRAETGFANDATISFVPGQTRYGAQAALPVSRFTSLRLQYDHEANQGIAPRPLDNVSDLLSPGTQPAPGSPVNNRLSSVSVGAEQRIGSALFALDYVSRHREDLVSPSTLSADSRQLQSRLLAPLAPNLAFGVLNETSLTRASDPVFPDRTVLGLDWTARPGVTVRLAQIFFHSGEEQGQSITSLETDADWHLTSATSLTGRYAVLGGASGPLAQGALGINNRFVVAPGLRLLATYEHVLGNSGQFNRTAAGTQLPQPYAPGQGATAGLGTTGGDTYALGLEYTQAENWKASARWEVRAGSSGGGAGQTANGLTTRSGGGGTSVVTAGLTGKVGSALTALVRFHQTTSANQLLRGLGDSTILRAGLAYRSLFDDRWNVLVRYDYRKNIADTPETLLAGTGTGQADATFAAEAIYAPAWRWEFYGKWALRQARTDLAQDLGGTSNTLSLGQFRATFRLLDRVDLVGEARFIGQTGTGYASRALFAEAGYYLSPDLRLAVGYGAGRTRPGDADAFGEEGAGASVRRANGLYVGATAKLSELFSGFGLLRRRTNGNAAAAEGGAR